MGFGLWACPKRALWAHGYGPLIGEVRRRCTSLTGSHAVCGRGTRLLVRATGECVWGGGGLGGLKGGGDQVPPIIGYAAQVA